MKTFLITGASSGIGAETARLAASQGYRLVLAARSTDKLEKLAEELGGPDKAIAVQCDVTSIEDQQAMVEKAMDAFGSIDVVFANAGFGVSGKGTEMGDPEEWRDMILTNVFGAILTAKVTFSAIVASKGHVVLTGSQAGRVAISGSVYGATKWAITGYGKNLREELKDHGCRVSLIEPGMVDTPFFDEAKPDKLKAEDIARAVLYAVSQPDHVGITEMLILPQN